MRRLLFVLTIMIAFLMIANPAIASTNVALNSTVSLHGAPFFVGGWGGGWFVPPATVVDGVFAPRSNQWDRGPVWWDSRDRQARSIEMDLDGTFNIESLVIQADDNDAYRIYYWDLNTSSWQLLWGVPNYNAWGWGMQTRPNPANNAQRYSLAIPVVTNALKFEGNLNSGDRLFSVSEIQAFGTPYEIEVDIDIKPGSDPNSINMGGNGVIPVAILGSDTFDVTEVDPLSVLLEGAALRLKGKSGNAGSYEDVNADGFLDLVVHILDFSVAEGSTDAILTGETYGGQPIHGSDSIRLVP